MHALNRLRIGVGAALAGCATALAQGPAGDNVAGSWHFAGAARLAGDTNFAVITNIFALPSSVEFQNLVLTRFAGWLAGPLQFSTNVDTRSLVRPLLDDWLRSESMFAMGGAAQGPLNFILAVQLDDPRARVWQDNLRQALGAPGKSFKAQDFAGQRWDRAGGGSFWVVRARDWLLVGAGDDLQALLTQYTRELSRTGRPGPALGRSWLEADAPAPSVRPPPAPGQNWLEADLDWPRLAQWLPAVPFSLKLARTQIAMTTKEGTLRMKAKATYPQPIPWKYDPWRIPTNVISVPLSSFSASQDLAALMKPDQPLSKLSDNPLAGQLYAWAMGQMGLQSYAAWPVADATNTLQRLASQAPTAFNPDLARMNSGSLVWHPERKTLAWEDLVSFLVPTLQAVPETNGQFLLASLFPLAGKNNPPPADLLDQFAGRTNLVYYDWEQTGSRLQEWRLLGGILPVLPKSPPVPPPATNTNAVSPVRPKAPVVVEELWLNPLWRYLSNPTNQITVTEITRTGSAELTIVRKSPFALTSLELVMVSHWLTGTGSPGINVGLLPPPAKVSGPGINLNH